MGDTEKLRLEGDDLKAKINASRKSAADTTLSAVRVRECVFHLKCVSLTTAAATTTTT